MYFRYRRICYGVITISDGEIVDDKRVK